MADDRMMVKVYSPFKVYYDGPADSLSAKNETGPFDILPHHKNFMSLLKPGNITLKTKDKPDFSMTVQQGVLHVRQNRISLFLDV